MSHQAFLTFILLMGLVDVQAASSKHFMMQLDLVMTFSPLTSDFCPTGESSETLVTVTSDLGNFRGVWHLRSPLDWLFKLFYPFPFSHVSAYIDAIMEESIAVRTKVTSATINSLDVPSSSTLWQRKLHFNCITMLASFRTKKRCFQF